jgi:hypothetical protein
MIFDFFPLLIVPRYRQGKAGAATFILDYNLIGFFSYKGNTKIKLIIQWF